jgi:hypothetical protein
MHVCHSTVTSYPHHFLHIFNSGDQMIKNKIWTQSDPLDALYTSKSQDRWSLGLIESVHKELTTFISFKFILVNFTFD